MSHYLVKPVTDLDFEQAMENCCILNPEYVALGGTAFHKDCLSLITDCFYGVLPFKMSSEILYAEYKWHDYFEGMAYLTANQFFADVRLVKE